MKQTERAIQGVANVYVLFAHRCRSRCIRRANHNNAMLSFGFDSSELAMIRHSFIVT